MKANKPFPANKEAIALALLRRVQSISQSKEQLIAKHEASLRALRLVQADRSQLANKGSK